MFCMSGVLLRSVSFVVLGLLNACLSGRLCVCASVCLSLSLSLCLSVRLVRCAECVQRPGDIVYVPSGWFHATVNIGDTAAVGHIPFPRPLISPLKTEGPVGAQVAQQVREFPADTARFKGNLSSTLMREATRLRDEPMAAAPLNKLASVSSHSPRSQPIKKPRRLSLTPQPADKETRRSRR